MRRRIRIALLAAAALIAIGAMLMALSDETRPAPARVEVQFPSWMKPDEAQRAEARRTLAPPSGAAVSLPGMPPSPVPKRDPFLLALPRDPTRALVVLEANALRHSRLGELFIDCVLRKREQDPFEAMRREAGLDPLKDIDRVAFAPEGLVVSGFFHRARFDRLGGEQGVARYGDQGRIYDFENAVDSAGDAQPRLGVWRDQLLVLGPRPFVRATIDRLEGRAAEGEPVIPEELAFGEAYGIVPGAALEQLFAGEHAELGRRLAALAPRIELHADAVRDVALVARVTGPEGAQLDDLGKSFGAALALGRLQAKASGSKELAELLEHARVERGMSGFSLELALPIEVVERWFGRCGSDSSSAAPE